MRETETSFGSSDLCEFTRTARSICPCRLGNHKHSDALLRAEPGWIATRLRIENSMNAVSFHYQHPNIEHHKSYDSFQSKANVEQQDREAKQSATKCERQSATKCERQSATNGAFPN